MSFVRKITSLRSLAVFAGAMQCCKNCTQRGFVHGDVRAENMVFTTNTSYLIVFNMVQQEGARYRLGYMYHEQLRHPEAQENKLQQRILRVWYWTKSTMHAFNCTSIPCTFVRMWCSVICSIVSWLHACGFGREDCCLVWWLYTVTLVCGVLTLACRRMGP